MDTAIHLIKDARAVIDAIPHDMGPMSGANVASHNNIEEHIDISATAPPVSTTKGSRKRGNCMDDVPEPHTRYEKKKIFKRCSTCGKRERHNSRTCGKERVEVPKRPRGRPKGSGAKGVQAIVGDDTISTAQHTTKQYNSITTKILYYTPSLHICTF
ncbi:hypothetical protein GUJ93_ZPchr0007g3006 [Zizania palustris]|uniref:Uncharacterized protein n=1 Tax=Zizania palustris TaxID=103762 RepID=A0A8J5TCU1_ZIZPA|nr:hypothetical protein GUJ93_ZPchr0007g3006 [Zizania palustris]